MTEAIIISSAQNERFKSLLSLREKKTRNREQMFLVEGHKEIELAQKNGFMLRELWSTKPQSIMDRIANVNEIKEYIIPESLYTKVGYREKTEGLIAVTHMKPLTLDSLIFPEVALIIVADNLEKPGNIGTLFRIADGMGATAVILVGPSTDIYNPNVIRNSVGTFFTTPFVIAQADEIVAWALDKDVSLVLARPDAKIVYHNIVWTKRTALIVGREHEGIQSAWGDKTISVHIPMRGQNDSLNVAVSTGILAAEWARSNP